MYGGGGESGADGEVAAAFANTPRLTMPQVKIFQSPEINCNISIYQVRAASTSTTPHYTIIDMVSLWRASEII